jgi:hypothetical protein
MATWIKCNVTTSAAITLWLLALSPIGHIGKGIAHILALATAVQAVKESQLLVIAGVRQQAITAMNRELESVDLALQEYSQEQALREVYGLTPKVRQEINQSLEHLYGESSQEISSFPSKEVYLAVREAREAGKSKTFIIENVLRMGGRDWTKGEEFLQQLLEEGEKNGW